MKIKYKHTNIIARDWQALAHFYEKVIGCHRVPPERDLSGKWLERGTSVKDAKACGVHVRLPGHGPDGPTLEIYQYPQNETKLPPAANREGFGHIVYEVSDVEHATSEILSRGGSMLGDIASAEVEGVGTLTFVYLTEPEGNIIELQAWR